MKILRYPPMCMYYAEHENSVRGASEWAVQSLDYLPTTNEPDLHTR